MMQADPLRQLRGIHLPAEPGWWPPAPGWWLLAALALAALIWAFWATSARWRRFGPARTARALCRNAYLEAQAGSLSAAQYLHRINELLKRFVIHSIADASARPLSGDPWLRYLDRRYGQAAFTRGAGRWLGAQRFRPGLEAPRKASSPANAAANGKAASAPKIEAAPSSNIGALALSNMPMAGPQIDQLQPLIDRFFARECRRFWKFWNADKPARRGAPGRRPSHASPAQDDPARRAGEKTGPRTQR